LTSKTCHSPEASQTAIGTFLHFWSEQPAFKVFSRFHRISSVTFFSPLHKVRPSKWSEWLSINSCNFQVIVYLDGWNTFELMSACNLQRFSGTKSRASTICYSCYIDVETRCRSRYSL
jgi:hypothetical protein